MRWKALAFLGKLKSSDIEAMSIPVKELIPFGNDMMDMIKNLEFKRANNRFQSNLRNDIRKYIEATTYLYRQTNLEI